MSAQPLKRCQIASLVLIVLRIFLRHPVYIILHRLDLCEDASLTHKLSGGTEVKQIRVLLEGGLNCARDEVSLLEIESNTFFFFNCTM